MALHPLFSAAQIKKVLQPFNVLTTIKGMDYFVACSVSCFWEPLSTALGP